MHRIYLDHNATTPVHPAVVTAMTAALRDEFGNPSSVHYFGQRAKAAMDEARSAVAALVGADPSEIVFTSGGTESDNFAIRGVAEALERAAVGLAIGRREVGLKRIADQALPASPPSTNEPASRAQSPFAARPRPMADASPMDPIM